MSIAQSYVSGTTMADRVLRSQEASVLWWTTILAGTTYIIKPLIRYIDKHVKIKQYD